VRLTPLRAAGALAAAALAAVSLVVLEPASSGIIGALGCVLLAAVSVIDLEQRRVPNRIVLPGLAAALVARTAVDPSPRWALGALIAGGALFVLAAIHPAGLGMGDVKLAAFLGAWLGWNGVLALVLGSFAGFLPALAIILARGRAARKIAIPFAPFLAIGGVVALLAGHDIVDWYRSLGS
jgi:leader peptidase (prepilin peptidase)/N-methyltransferase